MIWWCKNRGVAIVLACSVGMAVLVVLTGRSIRDIPVIFGGVALRAPLVFFGSLVVIVAHGWSVARNPVELELRSRRPVRWADVGLMVAAALPLLATIVCPCGSPQIVEGLRLRGVRDGRRGGLLVIDR
ncbi:hypothetical protein HMPREF1279_01262 [Propionibacterium sp. KPL1852]|nr:hypothetical protein HMPREF1271_00020 [Propionibacterium sp. KPL1838]ERS68889.1 hypothetical protein HMPREF1279_01262 [Propionibacterium sp. KPL1852]